MIFTPWNHIFSPGTVVKTFKMVNVVKWGRLQCSMCVVGILVCYHDYSVKIMSKIAFFCCFFSIFIYTTPPGRKIQHYFSKIKVSLKFERSGKFQVAYITSFFTTAFWSWVVISNSLRNPFKFTISDFRDPTMECSSRPTLRS